MTFGVSASSIPYLCKLEANWVVMTRPFPWCPSTLFTKASLTTVSLTVRPGESTLVESLMNKATPSLPVKVQEANQSFADIAS